MADANRAATTAKGSPPTAKRGRLSERVWADVVRAARLAREDGVTLTVHGVKVDGKRKPLRESKTHMHKGKKKLADAAMQTLPSEAGGEAPPPPLSKKQQRSAQRLREFQEKKRKELLQASPRVQAFLRQFRWGRMQEVWTRWMRAQQLRAKLRSLLWRGWTLVEEGEWGSLRDGFIYARVLKFMAAAGHQDTGRRISLSAWLHRGCAPMDDDRGAKRAHDSPPRPPEQPRSAGRSGKKSRGSRKLEASLG